MRVTRFMGRDEFDKLMAGEILTNTTNHREHGSFSESVGFCFTEDEPMKAWRYLDGVCKADVWVTFDFPDGYLTESGGLYADRTESGEMVGLARKREWCCTEYSMDTAIIVKMDAHFNYDGHPELNSAADAFMNMLGAIHDLENYMGIKLI